jgi:hypothetical protein
MFHGTDETFPRFAEDADHYMDGGVCLATFEGLARCYGRNVVSVALPDSAKLARISPREWFLLSEEELVALKASHDGVLVVGDRAFGDEQDMQAEDVTFFWDWALVWNIRMVNEARGETQRFPKAEAFERLLVHRQPR